MADDDEPQFTTLKERIAALNQQKTFTAPDAARKGPPPPPPGSKTTVNGNGNGNGNGALPKPSPNIPIRPASKPKATPPPLPRRDTGASQASSQQDEPRRPLPPQLPARSEGSQQARPQLPSRTSTQTTLSHVDERRASVSSNASYQSTTSSALSLKSKKSASHLGSEGRKLPPQFNQATLPPLPPSRRETQEEIVPQKTRPLPQPAKSETKVVQAAQPTKPGLPPRLPSRQSTTSQERVNIHGFSDKGKPPPLPKGWKVGGFSHGGDSKLRKWGQPPPVPARVEDAEPPPIPLTSRPSMAQIEAAKTRSTSGPEEASKQDCWICRDWSGPDDIAATFPRQSLPRNDPVGHLARGLCDPFPSYTDKARAIFKWFHYNIFYDTVSFFGKCVKRMTVEDTIFSGKAVCQGYAEVYRAIATRAGLDCVMVVGHGKGYGYTKLKPGERPPPPKADGHAWNAVRIDGGDWHLLDACWGAGHLDTSTNEYKQEFNPKQFTKTNEEFGESHFPKDPDHQFRGDGRTMDWDEYFIGHEPPEPPVFYTTAHGEGLLESSVGPRERKLSVNSGEVVRFQFSKLCEHWRSETHGPGKPPLLLLNIHGVDGRKEDMVPIETDGFWHWVDVHAQDLGAPGQIVQVAQITTIEGKDARGVTAKEYFAKKGKVAMGWTFLLKWELV